MVKAYSYIRFSTPEQRKGNSYERQVEAARKYCQERNFELLDELLDDGISSYRGQNRIKGKMGVFLGMVKQGKIERGTRLIIENLDRFSREPAMKAIASLNKLLEAGIHVVLLESNREIKPESPDDFDLIVTVMDMTRSHGESKRKQQLSGDNWRRKKNKASESVLTKRVPMWLVVEGDGKKNPHTIKEIPERAAVVKRIFDLAAGGNGGYAITRILNKEKVPLFNETKSAAKFWNVSYIKKILKNVAVFGRYVPHTRINGTRKKDGEPIENYYPAVISKEAFYAVQSHRHERVNKGGRDKATGKSLFSGLVTCSICGGPMAHKNKGENNVYYVCRKAELGGDCSYLSIHYKELEARVLARVPDLFGYEDEAPIQNASEIERIRCLIHEKTVSERNLVKAIQTKDALVSVLAHELATRTKELEELHRELDLAMGVDQRNKTSKQTMEELQKNIQQILHGKFNGIFDGKEEDRLKLKAYLSQVIKRIEIIHYWKTEGKERAWIAKIVKRNDQVILASRESKDEVYCLPYAQENELGDNPSEMVNPSQMEEKLETVH